VQLQTPLAFFAARFELSPRALRLATTAALLVSIVIVFFGGLVRVTGSGLGCPDWPTCDGTSIPPTAELGIHGVIEFANRVFTGVVVLAVGWAIVAARLQRPRDRSITRLAWSQFWLVVANAIAGGITVLVDLNPWVVALHFVLAMALLATTTLTWHRVREKAAVAEVVPEALEGLERGVSEKGASSASATGRASALAWAIAIVTAILILVGTLVSGTGPHSGDSADVPRMPLNWTFVATVHGILGTAVLALAIGLLLSLGSTGRDRLVRRRTVVFLVVVALQGLLGLIQSLTGLPESLVSFHLLGSALVWVGALRLLLDANPRLFRGRTPAAGALEAATIGART
jgi:cytochrome c oxidase assembly protein subunit 15